MGKETLTIPRDAVAFRVKGDCMSPFFRDGWYVFATECRTVGNIPHSIDFSNGGLPSGTPVVIEQPGRSTKFLVKFWHGVEGNTVFLRFANDGTGRAGKLQIPRRRIKKVWTIAGAWFNGKPPVPIRRPDSFPVMTAKDLWTLPRRAPSSNPSSLADVVVMANAGERDA